MRSYNAWVRVPGEAVSGMDAAAAAAAAAAAGDEDVLLVLPGREMRMLRGG